MAEYREIYCKDCKKVIGRYNMKYYSDDKIGEVIKTGHAAHVKDGHNVCLQRIKYKNRIHEL
ncbi:MAG: hypothetical protein K8823_1355 [Cenarchaeum symbiont of Oopsacas minuta]|nr:hypothetical protein [Cenarchaeum symbiont of Oopsacas minuta]